MRTPLLIMVATVAVVAAVCPSHAQTGGTARGKSILDADAIAVAVADGLLRAAPEVDEVWPGLWTAERRVLIGPYLEGSLLIGRLPRDFAGRAEPLTRSAGDSGAGVWTLPDLSVPFRLHFGFPVGGARMLAAEIVPQVNHFREPVSASTVFVYHELFHAYQEEAFADADIDSEAMFTAMERGVRTAPAEEAEGLRAAERAFLKAAVLATDDRRTRRLIGEYYEQLDRRSPRVLRAGEESAERSEGTASFVAYAASVRALGLPANEVVHWIVRDLEEIFPVDAVRGSAGAENWHMYAAGAAKAFLASRLIPEWRERIERGATLDSLLLEALID